MSAAAQLISFEQKHLPLRTQNFLTTKFVHGMINDRNFFVQTVSILKILGNLD